jgi:G3E family GTPase
MKTPIALITGYLGAGKTTLLRHIIDNTAGRKIAILMNEFGEIAIDSKVIKGKDINMTELAGGCVCCSLTGEFETAIKEIISTVNPEFIIVETTGVAEPDAIVGDITENIPEARLDCVVTIVDADGMIKFPSIGYTGRTQIEMADILLLNKIDLIKGEQIEEIKSKLKEMNQRALIVKTMRCKVPTEFILDTKIEHKVTTKHDRSHIDSENLGSFVFVSDKKMELEKVMRIFDELPEDIIRAKGFAVTEDGSFHVSFVFGRFDHEEFDAEKTELVFIGKNIDKYEEELIEKLKKCEIE